MVEIEDYLAFSENLIKEGRETAVWVDALFLFFGVGIALVFVIFILNILKNKHEFIEDLYFSFHTNTYLRFFFKKFLGRPLWRYVLGFIFIIIAIIIMMQPPFANLLINLALVLILVVLSWGVIFGFDGIQSIWK